MTRRRGRGSTPDGRRSRRRLAAGFVLLVGLSGGTMALQGDASVPTIGLMTAIGLVAGGALLWYLRWIASSGSR
ncbi:hypothetical protein [Natrialba swarupiae]|uniref:Uncharacterized protein n=1 Tax=Natrialba swarupiae TaxID=2448032 RepID=A0A5D5AH97_9EURY|nr:hypothetical protein [Natrialba swarupiae]MCW8172214.1 hypothetical protein [Natrialba swarupiae]TYT60504.1 hypothetical protein FYC77_18425 [Natrialba swarupiae]